MRVLVAEDDVGLRSVLGRGLQRAGYVVDAVADGEEALRYLRAYEYEVAILDWRMPKVTGLEALRRLRAIGSTLPVLILTARDTAADRVTGLDEGADDYLVKPFDFDELLARLRALRRRSASQPAPRITLGDVVYEPASCEVLVAGTEVNLTATELAIFDVLVRRSPAVVSRRSIAQQAWTFEADAVGSNTIDVHLSRLRSKLAGGTVRIESVRTVGYRMVQT
jgi:DNA-binding response OmpR family regulator